MKDLIFSLGYEQIRALKVLRDKPDIEGSALCSEADCSWAEMFQLGERGLIDPGMARVAPKQFHPVITDAGREAITQAVAMGFDA